MQQAKMIRSFDNVELYFCRDVPDKAKAIVVIVHGLGEHCHRYDYVTEELNAAEYGVYRFDNRGHGRSGGARAYLDDFNKFIDDADFIVEMARQEEKPIFMLGHSMGGFIAAGYGVKYGGKLAGQVFSGAFAKSLPSFETLRHVDMNKQSLHLIANILSHLICRSPKVVDAYNRDPMVLHAFTNQLMHEVFINGVDWLMASIAHHEYPCLILHGQDDKIVPLECSQFLHDHSSSKDKALKIYPELYHEILNEEEERDAILADIIAWMNERIKS
ncbi:MAG: lysophospholipase [Synergistaceae bacterium]|nr:lysophospholipase [Synergistaceae bacterium]MBP9626809.1 lysophospholipase [Synergistaceae bacterium]